MMTDVIPSVSEGAGGAGGLADARGDIRVAFIIAVAAIAQFFLALRFFGFLTGDDVEVLGEAFRRAVGFPYGPWEIRNLFVPDVLVSPFIFAADRLGIEEIAHLIIVATLPFIALSALTIWLVYLLGLRWGGELAGLAAALLFAFHWIPLGFGSTTYPRTLAAACIVGAALLIERFPFAAGAIAGVAFADRFSEIVYLIPLLAIARRRALVVAAGALATMTISVGIYDWMTWGAPFSSVIKFAHLTVVAPDFASRVKYQSPLWYLNNIVRWCAPTLLPLLYIGRRSIRWSFIVIPLIAFSAVRHKELRYLQALIPFLAVSAAAGFAILYRRKRAVAVSLLAISLIWNLHGLRYFAHKSMPAVMAARELASNPLIRTVVVSQLWAYGDRLYLGEQMEVHDVGTPPRDLDAALVGADAAALYETDFDNPALRAALSAHGFVQWRTFRDGPARAVVVFMRSVSDTSDRGRQ